VRRHARRSHCRRRRAARGTGRDRRREEARATAGAAAGGGVVAAGAAVVATAVAPLPLATRGSAVRRRRDGWRRRQLCRRSAGPPVGAAARAHGRLARRDRGVIVVPLLWHRGAADRGHPVRAATSAAAPPCYRRRTAAAATAAGLAVATPPRALGSPLTGGALRRSPSPPWQQLEYSLNLVPPPPPSPRAAITTSVSINQLTNCTWMAITMSTTAPPPLPHPAPHVRDHESQSESPGRGPLDRESKLGGSASESLSRLPRPLGPHRSTSNDLPRTTPSPAHPPYPCTKYPKLTTPDPLHDGVNAPPPFTGVSNHNLERQPRPRSVFNIGDDDEHNLRHLTHTPADVH